MWFIIYLNTNLNTNQPPVGKQKPDHILSVSVWLKDLRLFWAPRMRKKRKKEEEEENFKVPLSNPPPSADGWKRRMKRGRRMERFNLI